MTDHQATTVADVNRMLGVNLWDVRSFRAVVAIDFDEHGATLGARLIAPADHQAEAPSDDVQGVQAWMADDLHTALGNAPVTEKNAGERSWADWWSRLLAQVRAVRAESARVSRAHAIESALAARPVVDDAALRELVDRGVGFDLNPTMLIDTAHSVYVQWVEYVARLDAAWRDRVRAALEGDQ